MSETHRACWEGIEAALCLIETLIDRGMSPEDAIAAVHRNAAKILAEMDCQEQRLALREARLARQGVA